MENTTIPVTPVPVQKNVFMAVLAYISILVIISYLVAKDDPFVKFHIKQGLVLLVIEVIIWVLGSFLFPLMAIFYVIHLVVIGLAIMGIINASKGREKELPLVGSYGKKFTI